MELAEKLEKKKIREARELARWERQKSKPRFVGYVFFFILVITIAYMVDEIATNIGKFLELDVTIFFFGSEENAAASSERAITNTIVSIIAGASMLLRPLADKFGRKPFLIIYTVGMAIGMSIIGIANSIPGWIIGTLMIQMCVPQDMQQVYIQESVPSEKRGTYFFIIKGIATMSLMLVPLLRRVLPIDINVRFKTVYIIIGALGLLAAILSAIFMRESDVYIDNRIAYLKSSEEEREKAKLEKKDEAKRGGIINGFIYCFKHSQLRFLLITMCIVMFSYVLTENYNTIIGCGSLVNQGLEITAENYKMVRNLTDQSTLIYPITCGLLVLSPSLISDKLGRKKSSIIYGGLALVFYILFYIGSVNAWSPYILGGLIGAACGAVWSCGDLILLMVTESSATNMRVSSNACITLASGLVYLLGNMLVGSLAKGFGSDEYLGIITIIIVVFGLVSGLLLMVFTVKETKGADLHNVTYDD